MNKWIVYVYCFLPLALMAQSVSEKSKMESIDQQMNELQKKLHADELQGMKEEVTGQGLMIADWDAYSKEMQEIRKIDEKEIKIRKEIEILEERKIELQKKSRQWAQKQNS